MEPADLGMVLSKMARYARERSDARKYHLGHENAELLWAVAHMLHEGAEECLRIAQEKAKANG